MQGFLKRLFRPSQFIEDDMEDQPSTPSPTIAAGWLIITKILESEEIEIEVSAANMATIIGSFENRDFDIAKVEYLKVRRRFQIISKLRYWSKLEEQIGTFEIGGGGKWIVIESRFPVDAEKFYLKKKYTAIP